jgi:hypothetical protein
MFDKKINGDFKKGNKISKVYTYCHGDASPMQRRLV